MCSMLVQLHGKKHSPTLAKWHFPAALALYFGGTKHATVGDEAQ